MTTLFHLSDLHFGPKFNAHVSELVLQDICKTQPDLTILSGDLTMRGRVEEYEQARAYIDRIPKPVLTIPGNHDQPLYPGAMWERITTPWARYIQHIHAAVDTSFEMPGVFVVGMNDNRPILPGGFWSSEQRAWMENEFKRAECGACKVLVMHHQLNWSGKRRPLGQWFPNAHLDLLKRLGVELVLNGHMHIPITIRSEQGIVLAQAGTSMSTRLRHGHYNAYNLIKISTEEIQVQIMEHDPQRDKFLSHAEHVFPREKIN
ncbi:MAG: metallophosphoesterase [Chloroflexi bacterium]|nr:metallophosphoesterase [Chloroflexota bacterium]